MKDDLISRSALMERFEKFKGANIWPNESEILGWVIAMVDVSPAVDAVPVVRCIDCKYFEWGDYCVQDKMEHSKCRKDDFCSYGEKRNQDKASYSEVLPRFEDFHERNDECTACCPFYAEECSGDGDKRCLSADILELLKRGARYEREQ